VSILDDPGGVLMLLFLVALIMIALLSWLEGEGWGG